MINKTTPKPTITFACDQDWNDMQITEKGRFCSVCTKEVIDFTRFSLMEIQAYKSKNNQLCGRFLAEQVDLSLIKPIRIPPRVRIFTFVSSVLLSSQNANAKSERKQPEQIEMSLHVEPLINMVQLSPVDSIKKSSSIVKPTHKKSAFKSKKYYVYFTKKFPFVRIVKRRHLVGRVRIN